jgi:hypothetical protein
MRNIIHTISTVILCFTYLSLQGQQVFVRGRLISSEDSSPVYGGLITLNPGMHTSVSDQKGEFVFKTNPGRKDLSTRVLGFKQADVSFNLHSDTIINIQLEVGPIEIKEVTIIGDSVKSITRSDHGNIIISRASLKEAPRYFSEPDLIKSLQSLPGVVPGKDGTTDFFVRGGTPGQNVFLANGCYFFIPSHLLGLTSSFDLDFIDRTELIKDYFPSDIGGGASSVVKIDYRVPRPDSASLQLRAGLLTSGLTFQIPFKKAGLGVTGGIKRGNYSIYAPLLKKLIDKNVSESLPPNDYSFYDSYIRITHSAPKTGGLSYVFMRNHDNGSKSHTIETQGGDTLFTSETGFISSWTSQVHSLQWALPVKGKTKWIYDLNFNEISVQKENFLRSEKTLDNVLMESKYNSYSFSPEVINVGTKIFFVHNGKNSGFSGGVYYRFRDFKPNIVASDLSEGIARITRFVEGYRISEPAAFISGNYKMLSGWLFEGGVRLSAGVTEQTGFVNYEPRLRITHESSRNLSQHVNFVRLSQFDHSLESSNVGLRSLLWIPITKEFGPEVSDVYSLGVNGQVQNYIWSVDFYYKTMHGMVDFKPGASFLYATSINDLLDKIHGRSYGLETFLVKRIGRVSGNFTYTWSRSKRQWYAPEGRIWIPSVADRPHNVNIALKYFWKSRTSLGLNWVYSSGLPATMYIHNTMSGRWFETKNNIRYPDYHRLDFSVRRVFKIKQTFINLDFDIANVYNRRNTFYLREVYDETRKTLIYKNISLFPIMPSLSLSIQNSWSMK